MASLLIRGTGSHGGTGLATQGVASLCVVAPGRLVAYLI